MLSLAAQVPQFGCDYCFDELCVPLYDELVNFARRLTGGDQARAADVVQDSLMKAFHAWERWQPDGEPQVAARAWLYRIVANTFAKTYHHRRVRNAAVLEHREDILHATYGVHDENDPREEIDASISDEVRMAIAELSPDRRVIVELYYFEELGCDAIARKLGIPKNTVMTRLHRARAAMAQTLKGFAGRVYGLGLRRADQDALEPAEAPEADAGGIDSVVAHDDDAAFEDAEAPMYQLAAR